MSEETNLGVILEAFGFGAEEQQFALVELLYLSGAFTEGSCQSTSCDDNSDDGNAIKMPIESMANLLEKAGCLGDGHSCDFSSLLHNLNFSTTTDALKWLIYTSQQKFFKRATGSGINKERWNIDVPAWMNDHSVRILELADVLGFMSEIYPSRSEWDAIAVLGATGVELDKRITYLKHLLESGKVRTKMVFLLTGERFISTDNAGLNRDGGRQYLEDLAYRCDMKLDAITESFIAADIAEDRLRGLGFELANWECGPTDKVKNPEKGIFVIDTKRGAKERPNTIDTVRAFSATTLLYNMTLESVLYLSRQPNIKPQEAQIISIMSSEQASDIEFEVVGAGCSLSEVGLHKRGNDVTEDSAIGGLHSPKIKEAGVAALHILMALGGYLYSAGQRIEKNLAEEHNKPTA